MSKSETGKFKLIKGGTLIDGTGAGPVSGADILIEGSTIKAVGKDLNFSPEAEIIDATGMTVMPGLIDSHVHFRGTMKGGVLERVINPRELGLIQSISDAKTMLNAGYTTAKCCGSSNALFLKQAVAEGILSGAPRIVAAGYWLSQTFGHADAPYLPLEYVDIRTTKHPSNVSNSLICDGVDECIKATRYALRAGADFIKISTTGGFSSLGDRPTDVQYNLDEIKAIVDTAAQVGKYVTAHCEMSLKAAKQSIMGGVKTVDHALLTDDECIELAMEKDVVFVSTTIVFRNAIEAGRDVGKKLMDSYKRIHKAGATLATGTDTGLGVNSFGQNAQELELLVKYCDFSPMDAIVAATANGAKACFIGDSTGTIEPGKYADIIIVNGNPLEDITILQNAENVEMVILEGNIAKQNQ
ncbi:MAG: amidohydrolase family protein [Chloroflexi bacterium]|nr:amidohydrolase family protein [Chloroflexota bacterium]MBT7080138.1 amidohydrolase family protein [Chloroflexota bacterium]MBT7290760.1 amidohydrolase family protein [Chloroflexota bacterium]